MNNTTTAAAAAAPETWTSNVNLADMRERLVECASKRRLVLVRYKWRADSFLTLVVGKVSLVTQDHVGILLSFREVLRVFPIVQIKSLEVLDSRRRKAPMPIDRDDVEEDE